MQVTAVKDRHSPEKPIWYEAARPILFCCPEMWSAWQDHYIGFGEQHITRRDECNVNIYHCIPWPEGAVFESMAIWCCPWCGEPIIVVVED